MSATQSVILCEGFDDRAFLAQWLSILGCENALADPWGRNVARGEFGYRTRAGAFVRLHPCRGRDKIVDVAERYLDQHGARPLAAMLLCHDDDSTSAKWHAGSGCEDFHRAVWREPAVCRQLELLLEGSGAWATLDGLLGPRAA